MKRLTLALLLGLATQAAWSAGNNYADLERKEQQRLEQARRDHARRQQDSARANRDYPQRMRTTTNRKARAPRATTVPGACSTSPTPASAAKPGPLVSAPGA